MTVVPLVMSLLVTGIAAGSARQLGRLGRVTVTLFVAFVTGGALFAALAAPPILSLVTFDPSAFASLREAVPPTEVELPPFGDWIAGLLPANPIRAAADGAMLPLVTFSVILALAITRLEKVHRELLVAFFSAVSRTMFVIVEWILATAPIGVFCLVAPLAAATGMELIGAFGYYLVVVSVLVSVGVAALYPITVSFGGITLRAFARACGGAQAVAFSTRSSLATLPALFEATRDTLGLPERVTGVTLPIAISLFKFGSPIARITGTVFVARLYGIDLGIVELGAVTASLAALSFYSPGVPSGGLFILTPIYVALGLPVEGIGILIALDLIPDMFITTGNITADMTVTAIVARWDRASGIHGPITTGATRLQSE